MRNLSRLVVLGVTLLSCSAAAERKTGPGDQFPTPADFPGADAVVLLRMTEVETEIDASSIHVVESFSSSKKIFRNIRDHASVEIRLGGGEEITSLSARTLLPSGRSVDVRKSEFFTIAGDVAPGVIVTDEKKVRFSFPAVEPGAVLEYSYRKSRPGLFGTDVWEVQSGLPVLRTGYTLIVPALLLRPGDSYWVARTWRYKPYNTAATMKPEMFRPPRIRRESYGDRVGYRWSAENVPAFTPEPVMAPEWYYRVYVRFAPGEWATWSDLSSWYVKSLLAPRLKPNRAVTAKALELTKATSTDAEKLRSIFDFVKVFPYSSVALGVGRLQPRPPEEVLDTRWGDCKDKSILLIALLRAAGIPAEPVLVRTADEGRLDPSFPTFVFNHMIVRAKNADGTIAWLDPTVSVTAAGTLPSACEGIDVLVLRDDGSSVLEKTPIRTFQQNVTTADVSARIDGDRVQYGIRVELHGSAALRARAEIGDGSEKQLSAFCGSLLAERYRGAAVTSASASPLDRPDAPLVVSFEVRSDAGLQQQADLVFLEADPLEILPQFPSPEGPPRRYPLGYSYPQTVQKTLRVSLSGTGLVLRNAPTDVDLSEDVLTFRSRPVAVGPEGLSLEERFVLRDRFVYVDAWPRLQSFFRRLLARRTERIILARKPG